MGWLTEDDKMVARDGLANRGCIPLTQMRGKTRYRQSFWCFLKSSGRLDKAQACCNGCPLQSEEHLCPMGTHVPQYLISRLSS